MAETQPVQFDLRTEFTFMKILITIREDNVAPRFDLTSEVLIALCEKKQVVGTPRTILMNRPSSEELCAFIIKEDINIVICGGIEESHLQYLAWKKIQVIDSVIGPYNEVLPAFHAGFLKPCTILPGAKHKDVEIWAP